MGRRKATGEEQGQQQNEASMTRDQVSTEDLTSQTGHRENEAAANEGTEDARPAWPRRSMSQDAVPMRTLQPLLRAGRAESEHRYQYRQGPEADYEAVCMGQIGLHRGEDNTASNTVLHTHFQETGLNQSEQYSSGSSFQNHARQFREDYQPPQSDRPSRYQSEQNIRNNSYTYDCTRPNHGTSAGLRAPYVRPSWQNRIQNQGNTEWGPAAQARQSRSEFAPERQWSEGERYTRPFIKLPAFTGKEEWKVWINRFEAVAARKRWSEDEKLDELLPRIQGGAGEFVYSQLPGGILNDYGLLVSELNSRYRVVETSRTFAVKFSNRNQRGGETAEEYAAELKRLYDKAHGYRDQRTRQEDLVRRFLDGLQDETARFQVEFNKEPQDIDEAVYHVVNFLQTRQKSANRDFNNDRKVKKFVRRAQSPYNAESADYTSDFEEVSTDGFEEEKLYRVPYSEKKPVNEANSLAQKEQGKKSEVPVQPEKGDNAILLQLMEKIKLLEEAMKTDKSKVKTSSMDSVVCYHCSGTGHYARDCVKRRQGGQDHRNRQNNNNGRGMGYARPMNSGHRNVNRAQNGRENHLN